MSLYCPLQQNYKPLQKSFVFLRRDDRRLQWDVKDWLIVTYYVMLLCKVHKVSSSTFSCDNIIPLEKNYADHGFRSATNNSMKHVSWPGHKNGRIIYLCSGCMQTNTYGVAWANAIDAWDHPKAGATPYTTEHRSACVEQYKIWKAGN